MMWEGRKFLVQLITIVDEHEQYREAIGELRRMMIQFRNDVLKEHPDFQSESLNRLEAYVGSNLVVPAWMEQEKSHAARGDDANV